MHNIKKGKNPNTGKEFLLFNVEHGRKLIYSGDSYQTRYGAEKAKKAKQIIVRADRIQEKINSLKNINKNIPPVKKLDWNEIKSSLIAKDRGDVLESIGK